MIRKILAFGGLLLTVVSVIIVGCDNNQKTPVSNGTTSVEIAAVFPADGSIGVSTTTSVALTFTGPVDTLSVMRNLYLAGGQPMHEWEDSLMHYGGFGMMGMGMEDHMMHWIDSIDTPGEFHWNSSLDSCEYVPTSALMPGTDYVCVLYEKGMSDRHGDMMGGSDNTDGGYHMSGFTTGQ